jgi:hypothetical protein
MAVIAMIRMKVEANKRFEAALTTSVSAFLQTLQ